MFEQQAEDDAANEVNISTDTIDNASQVIAVAPTGVDSPFIPIKIIKQQAIAQRTNCDARQADCQYFELNTLRFMPVQPWLTSIMWQNTARMLDPKTPLASEDNIAKDTVLKLLNQIEYSEKIVDTLPMYQRIDTELVLNPVTNSQTDDTEAVAMATGYLGIHMSTERFINQRSVYVMLDMQKKLQLMLDDILLPQVSKDELLLAIKTAQKEGLALYNIEGKNSPNLAVDSWPQQLSKQWYLDTIGLHMVYHNNELPNLEVNAVDIIVPYASLQEVIKPYYVITAPK